jgi:hypothetical protein
MFSGVLVPDELVRYRGLSPMAKILWARLARYARDSGSVFPAVSTLARELGVSTRQIQRALASLERERFLRRSLRKTEKGDYTSTKYLFLWHSIFAETPKVKELEVQEIKSNMKGVVTDMSPRGERNVTTMIKERLEEKTSSSPLAPTSPSPTPSPNLLKLDDDEPKPERAELIDLIWQSTGHPPDRRLVRDITEGLELRGVTLREYMDDILPQLGRLTRKPGPGFFRYRMSAWGDGQPAQKSVRLTSPNKGPCPKCFSAGKTAAGYCECAMGRDLEKVESRAAKKKAAQGEGGSSTGLPTSPSGRCDAQVIIIKPSDVRPDMNLESEIHLPEPVN